MRRIDALIERMRAEEAVRAALVQEEVIDVFQVDFDELKAEAERA